MGGQRVGFEGRSNFFYAADNPRVRAASLGQQRADSIAADARCTPLSIRRPPPVPPPPLEASREQWALRVAEEILYARRLLELTGDRLVADPTMAARHGATLQSFDIVAQMLGHLSTIVAAEDRDEAIGRVGLGEMRARLLRRGLEG